MTQAEMKKLKVTDRVRYEGVNGTIDLVCGIGVFTKDDGHQGGRYIPWTNARKLTKLVRD